MGMARSSGDVRHDPLVSDCVRRVLTYGPLHSRSKAHAAWEKERPFGIPLPEKLYTSPLTRAIRTNQVTFDDTILPSGPKTIIVEVSPQHVQRPCPFLIMCMCSRAPLCVIIEHTRT